ncbi:hypothetical protein SmJEL517_g04523 [Synchytrium microbalum]|uniref:Uncharacterized protein n=1 Tax=Synchytrium microbalum TaxID=1806994 RepID=A0A507BTP8_9FUNG|nr:uncharacterized protein SmJEL517_g04523 [Synchytrium microbalum]TPX32357.1 hypothetical protein SmJEL517_g04523 [Synchytrium microbalum]
MSLVVNPLAGKGGSIAHLSIQLNTQDVWEFDGEQLLATVEFPHDKYERLIRVSPQARKTALARISLNDAGLIGPDTRSPSIEDLAVLGPQESSTLDINYSRNSPSRHGSSLNVGRKSPTVSSSNLLSHHTLSRSDLKTQMKEREQLLDQLCRSAAALTIQACWRGWNTKRRYFAVTRPDATVSSYCGTDVSERDVTTMPKVDTEALRPQNMLIYKYHRYCQYVERARERQHKPILPLPDFPHFCAAVIQSKWRSRTLRKKYKKILAKKQNMSAQAYQKQILHLQYVSNLHGMGTDAMSIMKDESARKIQRAFRGWQDRRVYAFYRSLIRIREGSQPHHLFRVINPRESHLIDPATEMHMRFRLGGIAWPPVVYYKIFTQRGIVDLGSFAPREYFSERLEEERRKHDGWYKRVENNGWRPVSDKMMDPKQDDVTRSTTLKMVEYHHSKLVRHQDAVKRRRTKKIDWLKQMYTQGKEMQDQVFESIIQDIIQDEEDDELLRWTQVLDFDAYLHDWLGLATTGLSVEERCMQPLPQELASACEPPSDREEPSPSGARPWSAATVGDILLSNNM